MNKGFDPKEIAKIKDACNKTNKPFTIVQNNLETEGHANFFFVGKHQDKEVIFDAFIYPLEMEYFSGIFETAIELVIEDNSKFEKADFSQETGEHIELLHQTTEALTKESDFDIQEFLELDEDNDYGIALDVCLNVNEISEETIHDFVTKFNEGTFELDSTFYSFVLEE